MLSSCMLLSKRELGAELTRRPSPPGSGTRHAMSTVVVFGGSGFAGKHIVDELADRGHTVLAVARKPESLAERSGVRVHAGSALDADFAYRVSAGADVIVAALPAVDDEGHTLDVPVSVLLEA